MKRSEMEHKVKEWLLTNGGTQAVDIPRLLNFLESKGMLPPAYEKFVAVDYKFAYLDETIYRKIPTHEWEKE